MTPTSEYRRQVDASMYAVRSDILETLRQRIHELQEQQICNLKEIHGIRWIQMTQTAEGSGYAICQEILNAIEEIQRQDFYDLMTPHTAASVIRSLNQPPAFEQLFEQLRQYHLSKFGNFEGMPEGKE